MAKQDKLFLSRYESELVLEAEKESMRKNFLKAGGYSALGFVLISASGETSLPLLKQVSAALKELPPQIPFYTGMASLLKCVHELYKNVLLLSDQSNLNAHFRSDLPYTELYTREGVDEIVKKYEKKRNQ